MKRGLLHRREFVRLVSGVLVVGVFLWCGAPVGLALPSGEQVAHGDVSFTRSGNQLIIDQGSSRAIINYSAFNIDQGESVRFVQPGSSAAALNRVTGGGASTLAGSLQANGSIYLVNPSGIIFTPSAQVDVHGLVASAMQISDGDFLSGAMRFTGAGGSVVNQGVINAAYVALLGGSVRNEGTVNAGTIQISAGAQSVRLAEVQGGSIELIIEDAAAENAATEAGETGSASESEEEAPVAPLTADLALGDLINTGTLDASGHAGGQIDLVGWRIAHFGTATADGLVGDGGTIRMLAEDMAVLGSDSVTTANAGVAGDGGTILLVAENAMAIGSGARIEARGGSAAGDGGFVETSGLRAFRIGSAPDVSAPAGDGGTWLIDPYNITIDYYDGSYGMVDMFSPWEPFVQDAIVGAESLLLALRNGTSVRINTTISGYYDPSGDPPQPGNITLVADLDIGGFDNTAGSLTLEAHNDIVFNGSIRPMQGPGQLNLNLYADWDDDGAGGVFVNNTIDLGAGSLYSQSQGFTSSQDGDISAGGSIVVNAQQGDVQVGAEVSAGTFLSLSGANIATSGDGGITSDGSAWLAATDSVEVGGGIRTFGGYVGVNGGDVHIDSLIETGGGDVSLVAQNDLLVTGGVDARGAPAERTWGGTIEMVGGIVHVVSEPVQTDYDGNICIRAPDPSGTVEVDAPVHAEAGVIEIVAGGDTTIGPSADIQTVSGDILLHGGIREHDGFFGGTTSIGEGDLLLAGAVSSQSGQILGVGYNVAQSGGSLSSASGNVGLLAANALDQTAGSIDGANVLLESDGPMRLDGTVTAADNLLIAVNAGPLSGAGSLAASRIGIKVNGNVTGIGVNAGDELLVQMLSGRFLANNIGVPQSLGSNAGAMEHNLRCTSGGNDTQGDALVLGPDITIVGQPRFVPGDTPTDPGDPIRVVETGPGDPIRVVETGPGPTGLSLAERLEVLARFSEETPNMKERARLFDEFVFLHLTMQISEFSMDLDLNFVDYLLFGEARIAANSELPASAKDVIYIGGIRPYRVTTSSGPSYQGVIR